MEVTALELAGALLLKPRRFSDARGFFVEQYNKLTLVAHGVQFDCLQDNLALSVRSGTVRGLHFQSPPSEQAKLVSVLRGAIFDVLVDLRFGSLTYGHHVGVELSAADGTQVLVPRGFAHGYCTLADETLVQYKVDAHYDPTRDKGLLWNDPDLSIRWPVTAEAAILADKDRFQPRLRDLPRCFEAART
jgi:dTDP-4-dehydrorhamnose 3,5-epimerase